MARTRGGVETEVKPADGSAGKENRVGRGNKAKGAKPSKDTK